MDEGREVIDGGRMEEDGQDEEEPRLKYQRLGASVTELFTTTAATCLCVSDKILALGTLEGSLHVLDVSGNEVIPLQKLRPNLA